MKTFPLDIRSVEKYGLEKWHKEDLSWPVNYRQTLELWDELLDCYAEVTEDCDGDVKDYFRASFILVRYYLEIISNTLIKENLEKSGYTSSYEGNNVFLSQCLEDKFDEKNFELMDFDIPNIIRRIEGRLKVCISNLKQRIFKRASGNLYRVFRATPVEEVYADSQNKRVLSIYPFSLFNGKKIILNQKLYAEKCEELISKVKGIAKKYEANVSDNAWNYLSKITLKAIASAHSNIKYLEKKLNGRQGQSIFVTRLGKPLGRSFSLAAQRQEMNVISLGHGNNIGFWSHRLVAVVELCVSNTYIVGNPKSIPLLKKDAESYLLSRQNSAEIISMDLKSFQKIWAKESQHEIKKEIKTVMLLEGPLGAYCHKTTGAVWFLRLRLLLNLAVFLRANDFNVILKKHPDTAEISKGIMDDYFDEVLIESFEKVYHQADAVIFPDVASTTFGFTIATNTPIILFETSMEDFWPELHEPLRKRCSVIPATFDGLNPVDFDETQLLKVLQQTPKKPNTELLEEYML